MALYKSAKSKNSSAFNGARGVQVQADWLGAVSDVTDRKTRLSLNGSNKESQLFLRIIRLILSVRVDSQAIYCRVFALNHTHTHYFDM